MLGEWYEPKGLALETARTVLDTTNVRAVNVAWGCPNGCKYCYGPLAARCSKEQWRKMRQPTKTPLELVRQQLSKYYEEKPLRYLSDLPSLFASFFTDPFHPLNRQNTQELVDWWASGLNQGSIATLSKLGIPDLHNVCRSSVHPGLSIVSLDEKFRECYEPNTLPYKNRLRMLCVSYEEGCENWASLEPYPCWDIWPQRIDPLLEELKFWGVRLIVFGKWNYDARANTEAARQDYENIINTLRDFCRSNAIRLHVKSDTLEFVSGKKVTEVT